MIKKLPFDYYLKKEERTKIRSYIMPEDHRAFHAVGIVIICFQLCMLVMNLLKSSPVPRDLLYRGLYLFLIIATAVALVLLRLARRAKEYALFYSIAGIHMFLVFLWAGGVTYLGCQHTRDLSTFAYAMITCVAIVTLEPWKVTFNTVVNTLLLNLALYLSPEITYQSAILIQSVSICALANVVSVVCFNYRLRRIRLELTNREQLREIQKLNAQLSIDAHMDALTGVYNRRYLTEHIDQPLILGEKPSGVLMLDIDHFKVFNDTHGHQNGDRCLAAIGSIVKSFLTDPQDYAVRYGGEEFLIYYREISVTELAAKAEELRTQIGGISIELSNGKTAFVTASIGYASARSRQTYSELIGVADRHLYSAKENGRNRIYPGLSDSAS